MITPVGVWQSHEVAVTANLIPRYLWTTASIDVFVESRCVLKTGGKLKVVGSVMQTFQDSNGMHTVELKWGRGSMKSFPIEVFINNESVAKTAVSINNWPMSLCFYALLIIGGVAWVLTH